MSGMVAEGREPFFPITPIIVFPAKREKREVQDERRPKIDNDTPIRSAMTSSIECSWCKASSSLPSTCREDDLTICRAKKWTSLTSGGQKINDNDQIFEETTVETASRSSID